MTLLINSRLNNLRKLMNNLGVDAVIVPSTDPHQSEYVADHWQERAWISGFTGSAGLAVITSSHAGVWTDSRYYLQAEMETKDSEFVLHKMPDQFASYYLDFLVENISAGQKVAINSWMFSKNEVSKIKSRLKNAGIELDYNLDLITPIWTDRPSLLNSKAEIHNTQYTGADVNAKVKMVRSQMQKLNIHHHFISALDDLAWVLNLRGQDVEYNPVNIAYLVISKNETHLFIDSTKLDETTQLVFQDASIIVHPYEKILDFLKVFSPEERMLIDPNICSQKAFDAIACQKVEGVSIPKSLKAIKNNAEIAHTRNAMIKDAAALAHTFYELEQILHNGHALTEVDLSQKLAHNRSQQLLYKGESFGAIVGYKSNGAIIHYHPEKENCKTIEKNGILLVDSGGQYLDGTTDITRTFSLGEPSQEEVKAYTLVLKGMIALSKVVFPKGTMGVQLDVLARQYLWSHGLNYGHGTGHGVGFFLNVHEPPQGFTAGLSERGKTILEPGMITSNEPGYYKEGSFGMRIENLIVCENSKYDGYLSFETLTLYPFEHSLIDIKLLTQDEILWINDYHKKVFHLTESLLSTEIKSWFKNKCREITTLH